MGAIVVLTGGIGSGKSTAARLFAQLGVPVLDTDLAARAMHQDPAHPAAIALAEALPQAMDGAGRLARRSLREIFSADARANAQLLAIVAPYVLAEARRWSELQCAPYVIWESALLADYREGIGCMVALDAGPDERRARIARRNPDWTDAEFAAVCAMQPAREHYVAQADHVLDNHGDIDSLRGQVDRLHRLFLTQWS